MGYKMKVPVIRIKYMEDMLEDTEQRHWKCINKFNQYSWRENLEIVGIPDSVVPQEDLGGCVRFYKEVIGIPAVS